MAQCETVKVKHEDGYMLINADEFVEGTHVLFVERPAKIEKPAEPEPDAAPKGKAKK